MKKIQGFVWAFFALASTATITIAFNPTKKAPTNISALADNTKKAAPKVQVAILLDVSNSMDGLIDQAKAQLWNMVSVLGKATCNGVAPTIEIALYEYGRTSNSQKEGYVKQINGFINSLDSLSENLFALTTNGGDEYCGKVIYTAIEQLQWDVAPENYKVIFIAGNEDFLQGTLKYTEACTYAKQKGIILNTIYCGDKKQGIIEHWNLGGECGSGSFTNINSNAKFEDIATPYDSTMYVLNTQLNGSYVTYNSIGIANQTKQGKMDMLNTTMNKSVGLKRIAAKANKAAYKNDNWDLVDAYEKNNKVLIGLDTKMLPDSLKNKSTAALETFVQAKIAERGVVQKQIDSLNTQRENYLIVERKKRAENKTEQTLETEVEKIIKQQAIRYNIIIQ